MGGLWQLYSHFYAEMQLMGPDGLFDRTSCVSIDDPAVASRWRF